ncbi:translation initiation factor IF-2 [Candidatus Saganbacteria bacterium]|nr:translation initiation factor IF-2 [Candidatus Saganbacteria bacterium]
MEKIKVSALAKELNKTSKELLAILKDVGVDAKTAASSIDPESAKIVRDLLSPKTATAPDTAPKRQSDTATHPVPASKPTPEPIPTPEPMPKTIRIPENGIILKDFADKLNARSSDIIKELMKKGIMATLNQKISSEMAQDIGAGFSFNVEIDVPPPAATKEIEVEMTAEETKKLKSRPPVVTIMGHVDHGKTKLLDTIRSTKVAESEAGGITQHIGAYQVQIKGRKITFLDTPGHEAFTALRARGAKVTDVAIIVVAADDGVMPQTIEAIDHAKAAGVPIIVAINKVDKPDANPDHVKQQLSELGLQPEEWGGSTVTVPVSAKQKTGIDELLEMILLVADLQELKANPDAKAVGVVIESRLDKGKGPIATLLIKNGTLYVGDIFTLGATSGKIRALISDKGERTKKATPSTPVEISGIAEVPIPGDILQVMDNEKEAKNMAEQNKILRSTPVSHTLQTLEEFSKEVEGGEVLDLNLIIKADVQGSLEALIASLKEINVESKRVNIIHSGVGNISESDVLLAEASKAILIGFHVDIDNRAREISEAENIRVKIYDIIYKLLDDVKMALEGSLKIEYEEVVIGKAEVRQTFKFSKVGVISGCFVISGKMLRGAGMRIFRNNEKIYEGKMESLKRFKEDVKEVMEGYECGIAIVGYEGFKQGDIIECFEMREKTRK